MDRCPVCGWTPPENEAGSQRAHCPRCLSGRHGEDTEGYECGGTLEPISVWVKPDGAWELIQRCRLCGELESSPVRQDDNRIKLLSVAAKPLAQPPFPIEKLEQLTALMGGRGDLGGHPHEQGE